MVLDVSLPEFLNDLTTASHCLLIISSSIYAVCVGERVQYVFSCSVYIYINIYMPSLPFCLANSPETAKICNVHISAGLFCLCAKWPTMF